MDIHDVAQALKMLGYENRLKAFLFISEAPACVTEIKNELEMSQPAVSALLADLKLIGLVKVKRDGKRNYYHMTKKGRQVLQTSIVDLLKGGE